MKVRVLTITKEKNALVALGYNTQYSRNLSFVCPSKYLFSAYYVPIITSGYWDKKEFVCAGAHNLMEGKAYKSRNQCDKYESAK